MRVMLMTQPDKPLEYTDMPMPEPGPLEVLVKVSACGICRTDLHVIDGELRHPVTPLIPGHQIVGYVSKLGAEVRTLAIGQRVGVPWLGKTCLCCPYCLSGRENLCDTPRFTGYQFNGGFAEYCRADSRFCLSLPEAWSDIQVAPLLCAGLIGWRALCKTGDAKHIALYGFGAAAHILVQVARYQGRRVSAFTRPRDEETQAFALTLGAEWASGSDVTPPEQADAAIIFAPDGHLVPVALQNVKKGGMVVCGGIHMSDIPAFPYHLLWEERTLCSVANLTRQDGADFLPLAAAIPVKTEVHVWTLEKANEALDALRHGQFTGAGVIVMEDPARK